MAQDLETPILVQINHQLNTAEKRYLAVTAIIVRMPIMVDSMFLQREAQQGDQILALITTNNEKE